MATPLMPNHAFTPRASATGDATARPTGVDTIETIWNAENARPSFWGAMLFCMYATMGTSQQAAVAPIAPQSTANATQPPKLLGSRPQARQVAPSATVALKDARTSFAKFAFATTRPATSIPRAQPISTRLPSKAPSPK